MVGTFGNMTEPNSYDELQGKPMDPANHPITDLAGKQYMGLSDMDGMPIKQVAKKKERK